MTELIGEIFSKIFGDNVFLATILVSMVPIMELKGGIPFGMSSAFWGKRALGRWEAFGWAYLGCSIVVVVLYFTFVPIMKLLRKTKIFKGLANFVESKIKKQTAKYDDAGSENAVEMQDNNNDVAIKQKSKKRLWKIFGVFCFVAIPLPLTGVWMGVCIAVAIGLNFWETFIFVQLGNLVAGVIISTICVAFPNFTHWLIYIFLILVIVFIIFEIILSKIRKNRQKNN